MKRKTLCAFESSWNFKMWTQETRKRGRGGVANTIDGKQSVMCWSSRNYGFYTQET